MTITDSKSTSGDQGGIGFTQPFNVDGIVYADNFDHVTTTAAGLSGLFLGGNGVGVPPSFQPLGGGVIAGMTQNATAYATSSTSIGSTGPGFSGQVLTSNGSLTPPTYQTPAVPISGLVANQLVNSISSTSIGTTIGAGTTNQVLVSQGTSIPTFVNDSTLPQVSSNTSSISTLNSEIVPVIAAHAANSVFAGPTTGIPTAATFRSLVAADIPSISSGLIGTLPVSNGGTGQTSVVQNTFFGGPSTGGPSPPGFRTLQAVDIPSIPLATGVTGILPIANGGTNAASTSQSFAFIGPTSGAGAPSFRALVAGDIPPIPAGGITGVLPILNGGTASTTATGTGSVVLATGPTISAPTLTGTTASGQVNSSSGFTATTGLVSGTNGGVAGSVTLNGATSGAVSISAAGAVTGAYTLPSALPTISGQTLAATTGGIMSWTSPATVVTTTTAAPSTIIATDANGNTKINNILDGATTTASTGGVHNFTNATLKILVITGTLADTWRMPVATTLPQYWTIQINNNATAAQSITNTGGGAIATILAGGFATFICLDNTTSNGLWDYHNSLQATTNANYVIAGPSSGGAGQVGARLLVTADLPSPSGTGGVVLTTGPTISNLTETGTTTANQINLTTTNTSGVAANGPLSTGKAGGNAGQIAFLGSTSGTMTISAPAVAVGGYTWPSVAPASSGLALTSNTSGVMTWASGGAPTFSGLTVGRFMFAGTTTTITDAALLTTNGTGMLINNPGVTAMDINNSSATANIAQTIRNGSGEMDFGVVGTAGSFVTNGSAGDAFIRTLASANIWFSANAAHTAQFVVASTGTVTYGIIC